MMQGNVLYKGKCYLWYENSVTINDHQTAQAKCTTPTASLCADNPSSPCINGTGVGRLATFATWADFDAVTGSNGFNQAPLLPVQFGVNCTDATDATNEDPFNVCAPSPILLNSVDWPTGSSIANDQIANTCSAAYPYVAINISWNNWITELTSQQFGGYICEVGENFNFSWQKLQT